MRADLELLTCTWRGDAAHFALQRAALRKFGGSNARHHVVVQTEDAEQFRSCALEAGVVLHRTADWLPAGLDDARQAAARRLHGASRRRRKVLRSLHKRTGWWSWLPYDGWQMQQISKLAFAAASDAEHLLVIDSDTLPVGPLRPLPKSYGACLCWSWMLDAPVRHAQKRWQCQALRLLDIDPQCVRRMDFYTEPPFLLAPAAVRALIAWLEARYGLPWYEVLLRQPMGDWSEFAIYSAFLRFHYGERPVRFLTQTRRRVLRDADWHTDWRREVLAAFDDADIDWLVVHSAQRKQQSKDLQALQSCVLNCLQAERAALLPS